MADTRNLATEANRSDRRDEDMDAATAAEQSSLATSEAYAEDMAKLQEEMSALKSTVTTLLSEARTGAAKTLKAASEVVTHQGTALAATASDRAHTFASELESLARRKPLSTIAGALVAGIIIGLMRRSRS
jgi:ElaB/YqjD/DUF883 family membrane-anchored ribosome-binding protein